MLKSAAYILLQGQNEYDYSSIHCWTKRMQDWLHFQSLHCV